MKKIFNKIFIILWLISIFFLNFSVSEAAKNDNLLDSLVDKESRGIQAGDSLEWLTQFIMTFWWWLQTLIYIVATIYFLIISIKLIFAEDSESELWNFKKWFIWISLWIIFTKIASIFINNLIINSESKPDLFKNWGFEWIKSIAYNLLENIITPFTNFLETWAAFIFILIAIYAFFKMITSNWDEEALKTGRNTVLYSVLWFILIKISAALVNAFYSSCGFISKIWKLCVEEELWIDKAPSLIINIINWMNSFIWIWVVLMIIYSWFKIIFSSWDEEKLNQWKKTFIYIVIWIFILIANYLILNFFIRIP